MTWNERSLKSAAVERSAEMMLDVCEASSLSAAPAARHNGGAVKCSPASVALFFISALEGWLPPQWAALCIDFGFGTA